MNALGRLRLYTETSRRHHADDDVSALLEELIELCRLVAITRPDYYHGVLVNRNIATKIGTLYGDGDPNLAPRWGRIRPDRHEVHTMRTFQIPPWLEGEPEPTLMLDNIAALRLNDRNVNGWPVIEMLAVGSTQWTPVTQPRSSWDNGFLTATATERGLALIADIEAAINAVTMQPEADATAVWRHADGSVRIDHMDARPGDYFGAALPSTVGVDEYAIPALELAMQRAWDEHCTDTGHHPDFVRREGNNLTADFSRGGFADAVADWLAASGYGVHRG